MKKFLTFPLEKVMVIQRWREGKRVVGSSRHQTIQARRQELCAVNKSKASPAERHDSFHVVGNNWDTAHDLCLRMSIAVDIVLLVDAFAEISDEEMAIVSAQVVEDDRGHMLSWIDLQQ